MRIAAAKLAQKLHKKGSCANSDRPSNFCDKTNVSVEAGVRFYLSCRRNKNSYIISAIQSINFEALFNLYIRLSKSSSPFPFSRKTLSIIATEVYSPILYLEGFEIDR